MKKTQIFALLPLLLSVLLLSALLFTSCGGDRLQKDGTPEIEPTKEDLRVAVTIDGEEISAALYSYFYENYFEQYGDDADAATVISETEKALRHIVTVRRMAKRLEIPSDSADEYVKNYILGLYNDSGKNAKAYVSSLEAGHLTDAALRQVIAAEQLEGKIYEKFPGSGLADTSDEAAERAVLGEDFICVKQILIKPGIGATPDADRARLSKALERARAGEDFDSLIKEYSDDLSAKNTGSGYYFTRYQYVEEFEAAAFALSDGELSGIVDTPMGICVILRLEKDEKYISEHMDELKQSYIDALFTETLEKYSAALPAPVYNTRSEQDA